MRRPAEEDGDYAGAKFLKLLEKEGVSPHILIFTSDAQKGLEKLKEKRVARYSEVVTAYNKDMRNIQVSQLVEVGTKFASFEGVGKVIKKDAIRTEQEKRCLLQ